MARYERTASSSARWRIDNIVPAPFDFKVDKKHLGSMTNAEFVSAFIKLQQIIISIYEDVEKSPYEWGYKDENRGVSAAANNRITDFLCAVASLGVYENGTLTVDKDSFDQSVKTHKRIDLIIAGLHRFGFNIDGYSKNSAFVTMSYLPDAHIIEVLYKYAKAQDQEISPVTAYHIMFPAFSYRWVEDPCEQKYETIYHVKMDLSSKPIQQIQDWLHEKADEYGYKIDKKKPFDKGCVFYKKGSKEFIHVGDRVFDEGDGTSEAYTKVIFRNVLVSEPEKIRVLANQFPGVFGEGNRSLCSRCNGNKTAEQPCSMRIAYVFDGKQYENCAYGSFYFKNLTLEGFKNIFELFILENKIK